MFRKDFSFSQPLVFQNCYRCGSRECRQTENLDWSETAQGNTLTYPTCDSCWRFRRVILWGYFLVLGFLFFTLRFLLLPKFGMVANVIAAAIAGVASYRLYQNHCTRFFGIRLQKKNKLRKFKYFVSNSSLEKFNREFWDEIYNCDAKTFAIISPYIPGKFRLSESKVRVLQPDYFGWRGFLWNAFHHIFFLNPPQIQLEEHLIYGDCRAAAVIETSPLLVATYSGELDCVVMLRFPAEFTDVYNLSVGRKLLTSNAYYDSFECKGDWFPGPRQKPNRWKTFHPIVADFLTDDVKQLTRCKSKISDDEWKRTFKMGLAYRKKHPGVARDGRPQNSMESAIEPVKRKKSKWDKYSFPLD